MFIAKVLIIFVGLAYFMALLLADRMERFAFEAVAETDKLTIAEANLHRQRDRGEGFAILVLMAPMLLVGLVDTVISDFDFSNFNIFTAPKIPYFLIVPIALGLFIGWRSGSFKKKHKIVQQRTNRESEKLPRTYKQAVKKANLLRIVSVIVVTLYLVIVF